MKKIPTLVGLALVIGLVGVVALTTTSLQKVTSLFSRADSSQTLILPPTTANISDTSFSVYWITASPSLGSVNYGQTTLLASGPTVDDRNSTTHLVRVTGLKPATKYYFRINSSNPSEAPLEVTTNAALSTALEPIFGKVLDVTNQTLEGALVVWQGKTVTLSKADGSFVLPVYDITPGQSEQIVVTSDSGSATVNCTYGHDQPLPAIKLGDNVNCDKQTQTGFTVPSNLTGAPSVGGQLEVNLKDKETVSTPLPTIGGKAGPNQVVNIIVHSAIPYSGSVKADRDGNWTWTPPANLATGDHTATITITNPDGTTQTITRQFTVISGEPILPITSGSPSANPTHKACVNNSCANISGAGSDSCSSDSDCAPPLPPLPPISTVSAVPVTPPPTPATGALENTLVLVFGGLALITLGIRLMLQ